MSRLQAADDALPHVYVMGAGHVGRAIANLLQHAPVHCVLVDMRKEELAQCQARVDMRLRAIPEVEIYNAPAGSAFIVLTHDHGLDFLLTSAALEIGHASYVGMIGSATKRAKLRSWCNSHCNGLSIDRLTCPIGATASRDKRPRNDCRFCRCRSSDRPDHGRKNRRRHGGGCAAGGRAVKQRLPCPMGDGSERLSYPERRPDMRVGRNDYTLFSRGDFSAFWALFTD